MLKTIRELFGLLSVIALAYGLYYIAVQQNAGQKDFFVSADSTTTFTGTVLINNTSCFEAGGLKCFLQVKSGETIVFVYYNSDDTGFCKNETASNSGRNMKVDAPVKIYGFFKPGLPNNTVLTCPNTDYYIQPF